MTIFRLYCVVVGCRGMMTLIYNAGNVQVLEQQTQACFLRLAVLGKYVQMLYKAVIFLVSMSLDPYSYVILLDDIVGI